MRRFLLLVPILVVGAAAAWLLWPNGGTAEIAFAPDDPKVVDLGQTLYSDHCAACHGNDLQGQADWRTRDAAGYLPAPPHDETGHTWHHPDAQLFTITKYGTEALVGGDYKSNMAGFGDVLSDEEIVAVLSYIKSTWPRPVQRRHDEINAAAAAAAAAN